MADQTLQHLQVLPYNNIVEIRDNVYPQGPFVAVERSYHDIETKQPIPMYTVLQKMCDRFNTQTEYVVYNELLKRFELVSLLDLVTLTTTHLDEVRELYDDEYTATIFSYTFLIPNEW